MTVWMDAIDDAAIVPPFDGKIFLKASRISEGIQQLPSNQPFAPVQRQAEQQQQQRIPKTSAASPRSSFPKPPSSSETLLAFGSDDNNDDNLIGGDSFMDIHNNDNDNDLIGLGTDNTHNLTKVRI